MEKKLAYFEVMDRLEKVLPSTVVFDYTKINGDELWERVESFLKDLKLKFSSEFLKEMEVSCRNIGNRLYNKKTHVLSNYGSKKDMGFDQNNQYIKDTICGLKLRMMKEIYEKYSISEFRGFEKINFGELDEVKNYIKDEEIRKYISDIFVFTKEKNDNSIQLSSYKIAEQIFLYFGIKCFDSEYSEERHIDEVAKIIEYAANNSRNFQGNLNYSDGTIYYDSVSYDMEKFDMETKKAIMKIVKYVSRLCNMMLAKGIESNERMESRKHDKSKQDKSEIVSETEDKVFEIGGRTKNPIAVGVEKTIDDIMTNYSEIQKLLEKRKKLNEQKKILYDKVAELQKELDETDTKLEELLRDSR